MHAVIVSQARRRHAAAGAPRRSALGLLAVGLVVALGAAVVRSTRRWRMDIAAWALFAVAVDLLLGYTGLLSFGHAAFWGTSAYATGLIAIHAGVPFPVAVLGGAVVAAAARGADRLPVGAADRHLLRDGDAGVRADDLLRRQPVARRSPAARTACRASRGAVRARPRADSFYFYYAALPIILLGLFVAWRVVHSPFGRVLVAIRDNPARARALGYPVRALQAAWRSCSRRSSPGWPAGVFAISHGFASLQELHWTTSGKVVLITVLGGIGTLWGAVLGAGSSWSLEDYLASPGFDGIGIVTGAIFVVIVLVFRRGIWGTARHLLRGRRRNATTPDAEPLTQEPSPTPAPQA